MDPKIIFEDEQVLVLDKPAGMVVNKADTTRGQRTMQDWVEEYLEVPRVPQVSRVPQAEISRDTRGTFDTRDTFIERAGIVHRLDKETSGIILVAKTAESFENLQKQFKERIVKKTYLALAHGDVKPEEGIINVPVGRLPWNRKQFGVVAGGRESLTRYKRIKNYELRIMNKAEQFTLLELYPETGRTHQIRVHLKHIGHPIFADFLYAGRKISREDRKLLSRVFLHASKISFLHPKTGKQISFESSLPEELQKIIS